MPVRPALLRRYPRASLLVASLCLCIALDLVVGWALIPATGAGLRRPHEIYHHDLQPNRSGWAYWGERRYPMATNSLGLRDAKVREVELQGDRQRILFMGDSFTEGIGVAWRESFVGQLQRKLEDRPVELLNAGVVGYSPKLYLRKTRHLIETVGLHFDALYLLLDNSDIPNEIIYEHYGEAPLEPPTLGASALRRLRRHSYVVHSVEALLGRRTRVRWNAAGMPFADDLDNEAFDDPAFLARGHWTETYAYAERGLALAEANMRELVQLCRRHDVPLTLVVYPWPRNIEYRERDHIMVRFWRRFSQREGIGFLELYSDFIDPIEREEEAPDAYHALFLEGDVHWSPLGHRRVADALYEHIAASLPARRDARAPDRQ